MTLLLASSLTSCPLACYSQSQRAAQEQLQLSVCCVAGGRSTAISATLGSAGILPSHCHFPVCKHVRARDMPSCERSVASHASACCLGRSPAVSRGGGLCVVLLVALSSLSCMFSSGRKICLSRLVISGRLGDVCLFCGLLAEPTIICFDADCPGSGPLTQAPFLRASILFVCLFVFNRVMFLPVIVF